MTLTIFCDGSALGNGKSGAVGAIGVWFGRDSPLNYSEAFANTPALKVTNQTMELMAATHGLRTAFELGLHRTSSAVRVYTDSAYTINCATKWIRGWERNGWRSSKGEPVLNQELIRRLAKLTTQTGATFVHVRAHQKEPPRDSPDHALWEGNDAADRLAQGASQELRQARPRAAGAGGLASPRLRSATRASGRTNTDALMKMVQFL